MFPEYNEILSDFSSTPEQVDNFMEIAKVLQHAFNQSFFPPEDVRYGMNTYLAQMTHHISAYYKELVNVNDNLVEQIITGTIKQTSEKIRSRSICISVAEIGAIVDGIIKMKGEMSSLFPEAVSLAENIHYLDKTNKLFGDKINPATKKTLKPHQAYLLFYDLIFPKSIDFAYLEEFSKMQGFSKSLPEEQKVIICVIVNRMLVTLQSQISVEEHLIEY